ncbi:MAG: hypothetical protein NTZ65_00250 [Candidatus Berkelbacteria bacterium]|nr:hypothetical protein [Candidatus Berkelbacteria bacterium]
MKKTVVVLAVLMVVFASITAAFAAPEKTGRKAVVVISEISDKYAEPRGPRGPWGPSGWDGGPPNIVTHTYRPSAPEPYRGPYAGEPMMMPNSSTDAGMTQSQAQTHTVAFDPNPAPILVSSGLPKWADQEWQGAVANGTVNGYPGGNTSPNRVATRAESLNMARAAAKQAVSQAMQNVLPWLIMAAVILIILALTAILMRSRQPAPSISVRVVFPEGLIQGPLLTANVCGGEGGAGGDINVAKGMNSTAGPTFVGDGDAPIIVVVSEPEPGGDTTEMPPADPDPDDFDDWPVPPPA